jgi:arginyl-tRNA synthetase
MNIESILRTEIQEAVQSLFGANLDQVQLQPTNQEFEGSHTLVCFSLTKISRKNPEETGRAVGEYLKEKSSIVSDYNVVKGFLNLSIRDSVWVEVLATIAAQTNYGQLPKNGKEIMIEYSSPNTNKPLHLGHLRNNFLGWSVAELYKANGYKVHKVQIINDRGIHICKSMAAWKLYGNGETPKTAGIKGDHFVGNYYVEFNTKLTEQVKELEAKGVPKEEAEKQAPIMKVAIDMLRKWEYRDEQTLALWKMMNGWVYEGFETTYKKMGVDFDKLYYESNTFLLGKEQVLTGVEKGVFFSKEDGSVWVDLTADGLDQKLLLRSDGTSVYMTQDIGTAILRFHDYPNISGQVYTVGNEQEYHFKVLFLILQKLGYAWAKDCYHLSYGMVDLPTGKMKSREGTVVDADDLIDEMIREAKRQTLELGKTDEMNEVEATSLFDMIGLGALKFFLLKVDPKKKMLFDPNESIQLQGFTGPFIQYTHARIKAILRKAESMKVVISPEAFKGIEALVPAEREAIRLISAFEGKLKEAVKDFSPAVIANYTYEVAKAYNQFYQSVPIFTEADTSKLAFRIALSKSVANVLKRSMGLLGIEVPERM